MKVNCVSCGHKVELDAAYDDYNGQVKCWACNAMLEIRTVEGYLKAVRLAGAAAEPPAGGPVTEPVSHP